MYRCCGESGRKAIKEIMGFFVSHCNDCGISSKKSPILHTYGPHAGTYCPSCWSEREKADNKILEDTSSKKEHSWNELITPTSFGTFIGQEIIKNELNLMLEATQKHKMPMQHVLFSGSFGLGKTTLAKIFASSITNDWSLVVAANVNDNNFPENRVVIVDEIHTLKDEEWLLSKMDSSSQIIIGATTTAGKLSGPLRSRFLSLVLEPYRVEELATIVKGASKSLKYDCPDFLATEVAQRSKTVARVALGLFKRVYDRSAIMGKPNEKNLKEWFASMGIDTDGLDNSDRAYLNCLSEKPVGIQYITAMTGLDRLTLEETIEPYLLHRGYVIRTPRGRMKGKKEAVNVWT